MADLSQNNTTLWDWVTWETLGNPSEKFQRGDKERKLGLFRVDYEKACKSGKDQVQKAHDDALGAGHIKVAVLDSIDYNEHLGLIRTFVPCMTVDTNGKLRDPFDKRRAKVPDGPHYAILPYNYDDNSRRSKALGTNLVTLNRMPLDATRLQAELTRWSTASRSSIAAIPNDGIDATTAFVKARKTDDDWPFRTEMNAAARIDKDGASKGSTFTDFQSSKSGFKYYSVKTGVQFVAGEDQSVNNKDILESNSIHAMHRSDLIAKTRTACGADAFEARYQLEILCVLLLNGTWDGFQVREIGAAGNGEVWFPALAIPSHGKAFATAWGEKGTDWIAFWQLNFAQPLGRAKAEMLVYFGLQHMTANAQNMLIVFDRSQSTGRKKCRAVTLRDLGDTLYNDHFFAVLNKVHDRYQSAWDHESSDQEHGVTLSSDIGGGYSNPLMTRLGTSIVFFFGPFMQGDLLGINYPNVLATWGIAHNRAFVQYMVEKIGYSRTWEQGKSQDIPQDILDTLSKYSGFGGEIRQQYGALVKVVLAMKAEDRWTLIDAIENSIKDLEKKDKDLAKGMVDAHDLLVCADIECYVKSERGKVAMAARLRGTSANEGLVCSSCGHKHSSKKSSTWGRWHKCTKCKKLWCNTCGKWKLWRPSWFVEERTCSSCGSTTELIE